METCERFDAEFLPEWEATGRLSSEHVRSCADCGARYASYRAIGAALGTSDAPALSSDWQQRVLDQIAATAPAATTANASAQHSEIRALRPASLRRYALIGMPLLAAAAGLLLFIGKPAQLPLPSYVATLEGGQRAFRDSTAAQAFAPGATLELLLRPEHAVEGEIGARVFVDGAAPGELAVQQTRLAKGVLRIKAVTPRAPNPGQGHITLLVVVGRADVLAQAGQSLTTQTIDSGVFRRMRVEVDIAP